MVYCKEHKNFSDWGQGQSSGRSRPVSTAVQGTGKASHSCLPVVLCDSKTVLDVLVLVLVLVLVAGGLSS